MGITSARRGDSDSSTSRAWSTWCCRCPTHPADPECGRCLTGAAAHPTKPGQCVRSEAPAHDRGDRPTHRPAAILRSRRFVALLVLASIIGVAVSPLAWGFLELIHQIQQGVFTDLPTRLGFDEAPWWWPLPILVLAGIPVAFALRLPGGGGHVSAGGLTVATTTPEHAPRCRDRRRRLPRARSGARPPKLHSSSSVAGSRCSWVKQLKRDAPQQMLLVLGVAGSFAAISMIFESPLVAAVLVIEATGLGGATPPLLLLPGLLAAGIGSLSFIGISNWAALDTRRLLPRRAALPSFTQPHLGGGGVVGRPGGRVRHPTGRPANSEGRHERPQLLVPATGAVVAILAIVFAQLTDHGTAQVLFSGQEAPPGLIAQSSTWSMPALALVLVCKGLAWAVSLGAFRGGRTFPRSCTSVPQEVFSRHTCLDSPSRRLWPWAWRRWRHPCFGYLCRRSSSRRRSPRPPARARPR